MKKALHIGDNVSWEGCMKCIMPSVAPRGSYDIMSFPYSFCTSCMPKSLSKEEIKRCLKGTFTNLYNDNVFRFADINMADYDKIVIWHGYDSNSLLLLYFFSTIVEGDLYHCIIKEDKDMKTGGTMPEDLEDGVDRIQLLSNEERAMFNEIYFSLSDTEGVPKIAEGYKIVCKSKEFVKDHILKNVTKSPRFCARIISETISQFPKDYLFDSIYLECLILEMIEDGTIKPTQIIRIASKRPYPIGGFYNRRYYYNGEDMGKWYGFSVINNKSNNATFKVLLC